MAYYPYAEIFGQVMEFNIGDDCMRIRLRVISLQRTSNFIWLHFNQNFTGISTNGYIKVSGRFDGEISSPGFWYGYHGKSDVRITCVSQQTAENSFCMLQLSAKLTGMGCRDDGYYYYISYFAPHTYESSSSDDNRTTEVYRQKYRSGYIRLKDDAVTRFYDFEQGAYYRRMRFFGRYGEGGGFVASSVD